MTVIFGQKEYILTKRDNSNSAEWLCVDSFIIEQHSILDKNCRNMISCIIYTVHYALYSTHTTRQSSTNRKCLKIKHYLYYKFRLSVRNSVFNSAQQLRSLTSYSYVVLIIFPDKTGLNDRMHNLCLFADLEFLIRMQMFRRMCLSMRWSQALSALARHEYLIS